PSVRTRSLPAALRISCAAGGASPTGTGGGATIEAASDIPVGCGLGSSAAAIVAGALLADAALELGLSRAKILEIATTIEGHPDKDRKSTRLNSSHQIN